jgi:glycosyltransferase involved in cell wall biosynthesis
VDYERGAQAARSPGGQGQQIHQGAPAGNPGLPARARHGHGSQTAGGCDTATIATGEAGTHRQLEVLILAPTSFFADYGCHVRILLEILALQRLGHRVVVCAYHNGEDVEGLHIVRTPSLPWRRQYEVGSSLHKVAYDALLSIRSLAWTLRRKPDIIHAHLHEGALIGHTLSRLWRVPLVFDFQGSLTSEMIDHGFLSPRSPLYRPLRSLERVIDHLPRVIIVSSRHAAQLLRSEFGCEHKEIHVLPDTVDTDLFRPGDSEGETIALKRSLGIPVPSKVVVYLGLLAEYQGTTLLLEAARALRDKHADLHFLIMGHPNVDLYRGLATEMGISEQTTFTGRVPYLEAPRYLRMGDVAVGPKVSATEGSGKLPNYMAMGLPTAAFDTPVSREYLGEFGVYARAGDRISLAEAISSMLEHQERATALGQELRERAVRLYSWPVLEEKLRLIYSAALEEG